MKNSRFSRLLALTLAAASPATDLHADVLVPGYSGFQRLALPGNSDSILAVPFARNEAAGGRAAGFAGNVISFQGAPGWDAGQWVFVEGTQNETYYLLIGSGTKEGAAFPISASTADSVTVELDGDSLAGLATGDRLAIIPHWTLGTLFPAGAGVHSATAPGDRRSEVLLPDLNAAGTNSSMTRVFYFLNNAWLEVGQGMAPRGHIVVPPDSSFTVRHNIAASTGLLCQGAVVTGKLQLPLGVSAAAKRDNPFGLQRPVSTTLAGSGLIASGAFAASPSPGNRTDELLTYDNVLARKNKAPSAIFYYWNNAWRKVGAGTASFNTAPVFTPGTGFLIRKQAAATAPVWTNSPNY